jgi:hypothetical protein
MRFTSSDLLLAFLIPLANAFPAAVLEAAASDPSILARAAEISRSLAGRQSGADAATTLFEPVPIFNAKAQYINVTKGSGHEYVAPGPNDLRGPCPGLNAFANHSKYTIRTTIFCLPTDTQTSYRIMVMLPSHNTSMQLRRWLAWALCCQYSCPRWVVPLMVIF